MAEGRVVRHSAFYLDKDSLYCRKTPLGCRVDTTETEANFVFSWIMISCVGYSGNFPTIIKSTTMHNLRTSLLRTLGVNLRTD